jgi:hypothetical protein
MSRREHERARIRLPLRLRWSTPFGQRIEVGGSLDASRSGLLVACGETHAPGTALWVTFPYDATLPEGQPEMPARVVRCEKLSTNGKQQGLRAGAHEDVRSAAPSKEPEDAAKHTNIGRGKAREYFRGLFGRREPPLEMPRWSAINTDVAVTNGVAVALQFVAVLPAAVSRNGHPPRLELRASQRRQLALPIHVRLEHVPWFEEAMTVDVSSEGLRFLSNREYELDTRLLISFEFWSSAPWPAEKSAEKPTEKPSEREYRVVVTRVEPVLASPLLAVATRRLQ